MIEENKEELNELYQTLVLEHSKRPRNFGKIECSCYAKGKNPSCGDEIDLYLKPNSSNDIVEDLKFTGEGCALCIASTSLMTQKIKNKSVIEAKEIVQEFISFIINETKLSNKNEPLGIFNSLKNFPLRIKCVLLGWRALEKLLNDLK